MEYHCTFGFQSACKLGALHFQLDNCRGFYSSPWQCYFAGLPIQRWTVFPPLGSGLTSCLTLGEQDAVKRPCVSSEPRPREDLIASTLSLGICYCQEN